MATTSHHPKDVLQREADARFWAQTGYRVGQRLDPQVPADKAMVPVWLDIYHKVAEEDARGRLRLTYNHPEVERGLEDAAGASAAAAGHVAAAAQATDPWATAQHVAAADEASRAATDGARRASAAQPATVSTVLTDIAAAAAAAIHGLVHDSILDRLSRDHPAITSPAAQPHPAVSAADPWAAAAQPGPPPAPTPVPQAPVVPPAPPSVADHIAAAEAQAAPSRAAEVHAEAAERDARGGPPVMPSLHPQTVASIRELAARLASDSPGQVVGVVYLADENWSVPLFGNPQEAATWYAHLAESPDAFRYLAFFNKGDTSTWPAPANEAFGSSRGLGASAPTGAAAAAGAPTASPPKKSYAAIAAIGAGIAGGAVLLAAASRRRRRAPL